MAHGALLGPENAPLSSNLHSDKPTWRQHWPQLASQAHFSIDRCPSEPRFLQYLTVFFKVFQYFSKSLQKCFLRGIWCFVGALGSLLGPLGELLGSSSGAIGGLGASWEPLGASWDLLGTSWELLGVSWGCLGSSWEQL